MRGRQAKAPSAGSIANRSTRRPKLLLPLAAVLLVSLILGTTLADATAPTVTVEAANVGFNSARAKGQVNPGEKETAYHFEYVDDAKFDTSAWAEATPTATESFPAGTNSPTDVEPADLLELRPGTEYHLRLVAENEDGSEEAAIAFTTEAVNPPSVSIDPVATFTATTAHFTGTVSSGGSNPGEATEYRFLCTPQCPGLEGFRPLPLSDGSPEAVQDDAENLEPNVEYAVTLEARNAQTKAEGQPKSDGPQHFTTGVVPPSASTSINVPEPDGSLLLTGDVNPHNSALSDCHLEFGLNSSYGQSIPCTNPLPVGGHAREVSATLSIAQLQPATLYHFRVVVASSAGTTESEDGIFGTPPALAPPSGPCPNREALGVSLLPSCRAWEMVSPPDKNGGEVTLGPGSIHAAASGDAITFESDNAFADTVGTGALASVTYRADRTAAGWRVHSLTPPQEPGWGSVFSAYRPAIGWVSPELSKLLIASTNPEPPFAVGAQRDVANIYLTDGHGGNPQLVTPYESPITPNFESGAIFQDISDDERHVAFVSRDDLTSDSSAETQKLYLWSQDDGVDLAGILPNGSVPLEGAGLGVGTPEGGVWTGSRALSADGSHVYFSSPPFGHGDLYLRRHNQTVSVAESEASGSLGTVEPAEFLAASADGARAFFSTTAQLVDQDHDNESDLYMYGDSSSPSTQTNLTLISTDVPAAGEHSEVLGLLGVSADGQRAYFFQAQPTFGAIGRQIKLFLWEAGALRAVATVEERGGGTREFDVSANWLPDPMQRQSRMSSDGRYILFSALNSQPGSFEHDGHQQVYRFDAVTNTLICVSCSRRTTTTNGDTTMTLRLGDPFLNHPDYASRSLSSDGSHVEFSTDARLVSADTNGILDVYNWTQAGVDGCRLADGCVSLLSDGSGSTPSRFADASDDGRDVYFVTGDRLSRADSDKVNDLYVARMDGGLPEPSLPAGSCEGDGCQPSPALVGEIFPASAAYRGAESRAGHIWCAKARTRRGLIGLRCARRHRARHRAQCVKRVQRCHKKRVAPGKGGMK